MASTILTPPADALKTLLEGIGLTPTFKSYRWAPRDLDKVPAAVIDVPTFERSGVDEPESQINADDWKLTYEVSLYFDLADAIPAQEQAVEYAESFVRAVDANPTLDGTVFDAKVVRGEPDLDESKKARPLFLIACTLETLKLVAP